jgi:hypothetical protein
LLDEHSLGWRESHRQEGIESRVQEWDDRADQCDVGVPAARARRQLRRDAGSNDYLSKGAVVAVLAELSGWIGALAVLAGYAAFSLGLIANGPLFQGCNVSGSIALILNGYHHGAWPSVILNVAWAAISTVALFRVLKARRSVVCVGCVSGQDVKVDSALCED